jgi:glycosyltransferase involved in cell wall biosynthesis
LPIVIDPVKYQGNPDQGVLSRYDDETRNLLFLGRLAPNKKQEDLLKLLRYCRRVEPRTRLILVGSTRLANYVNWLREFAYTFELEDHIVITGHVSQEEMIAYYRVADLYVSMSEHEGFGKPLIESMYFDLPVLAFSSSAVPFTLGKAGVLFREKLYEPLAEVVDILIDEVEIRESVIQGQRSRVKEFLEPQVRQRWIQFLNRLEVV